MTTEKRTLLVLALSTLALAACDLSFLDEGARLEARREAEGKAIGGACRHAGRAIEECYERNARVSKAAIFAGWRDMDGYMRENNIQVVSPEMPEAPIKQGENTEEKAKAAATPAEEKPKAVEAPAGKKAAEVQPARKSEAPATAKQGGSLRVGGLLRRFT